MAPAEGCRRIRPAGQRTPEHCLYGRIHPAYERPRTCRRQPGQLGQLARGRQHDAQRCAALHVGLRARPLGGLHALQLVAAGRHAEQVRRRQPDSVRRGFGAVRRPGKCQRRPVARPGQWLGHDLRRHLQLGGRPRLPALQAPRGRHRHRRYRFAPRRIHGQPLRRGEQAVRQGEFLAVAGRGILPRGGLRQLVALPAGDPAPDTRRETSRTDFALVGQDLSLVLGDAAVDLLHRRLFGDPGHARTAAVEKLQRPGNVHV